MKVSMSKDHIIQIEGKSLCLLYRALCTGILFVISTLTLTGTAQNLTGISGNMVTLDDREDHNWSYYSDGDQPIHSLNPADITITYLGYGVKTMTTTNTADNNLTSSDFDGDVDDDDVAVGPNDPGNTFVYYKTLENADKEGTSTNYPYTLIPNPFSKRPTGEIATVTPTTRTVYISGRSRGGANNNNYRIEVTYRDADNVQQTWSDNSNNNVNTTISVKTGTSITLLAVGRSGNNNNNRVYSTITARYDDANGQQIATATANNNNYTSGATATGNITSQSVTVPGWRGFYGWRVKSLSNGLTINGYGVGAIIPAETDIEFVTSSATGNEVQFEALWAQAYVVTSNTADGLNAGVSYERNFVVTTGAITANLNVPVTYSTYYPDGTGGSVNTVTLNASTLNSNTKFEYINLTGGSEVTANNHYLCFGRGISTNQNVASVRGMGGGQATNLDYMIRLESGRYDAFAFIGNGNWTMSGRVMVKAILGCDYDRANNNDNSKLEVSRNSSMFYSTGGVDFSNISNMDNKVFDCVIKSGTYQANVTNDGAYDHSIYCGHNSASAANGQRHYPGVRYITIEGGNFASLNGGRATDGWQDPTYTHDAVCFSARIKGGTFRGSVYGGAADNPSGGSKQIIITGGTILGWVAAGANGTGSVSGSHATTNGNSYIYVGGNSTIGSANPPTINETPGGNVFGAGRGRAAQMASIDISNVVVADNTTIYQNVYGGGYNGTIRNTSNVYILGGTVMQSVFGGAYGNNGSVNATDLGGTVSKDIPVANLTMKGGTVLGGVYGGSNSSGTVGNVTLHVDGGQVGTSSVPGNIHGGGYGQNTIVSGNVDVNLGECDALDGVTVYGDVYGGSALGTVNTNANNQTKVTLNAGTIFGSLYGGALGDKNSLGAGHSNIAAAVNGKVYVVVTGGSVLTTESDPNGEAGSGSIFGCNNINGAPQSTVQVDIYKTDDAPEEGKYALYAVYGGGNQSAYSGTPEVTVHGHNNSIEYIYGGGNAANVAGTKIIIWGGNKIGNVFGGGNGFSETGNHSDATQPHYNPGANITTSGTDVTIYGGTIGRVFGGSNQYGTIAGDLNVKVDANSESGTDPCGRDLTSSLIKITELYSGGNMAASKAGTIEIVCTGDNGRIDNVYGGARAANITTGITLDINGGNIGNVFGGNNIEGTISGNIVVNVEDNNNCTFSIDNVYGGGNLASYGTGTDYPQVNIKSGTITQNVYGGGLGASATVTGNPQVTLTGGTIGGDVFGGGDAAPVTGNPVLTANASAVSAARLFGGGKGSTAVVTGDTKVDVLDGTYGYVFGGGDAANMTGTVTVNIKGGTITNDVYGGGALANTNTSSGTTTVTLTGGTVKNVYGGGLGDADHYATVGGPVEVKLNEGVAETAKGCIVQNAIFGCNNVNGSPLGTVTVHVFGTQNASASDIATKSEGVYDVKAVYGGGNEAEYLPTDLTNGKTVVIIDGCGDTSIDYVYGGGNAASVPATDVTVNGCYEIGWVFGGGNGKDALANGNPNPGANVGYHKYTIPEGSTDEQVAAIITAESYGSGETSVKLFGGKIHNAFGGSNTKGNVKVLAEVILDHPEDDSNLCALVVDNVFGAGNQAPMDGTANIILGCVDYLSEIYGGANQADLNNNIVLTIQSGSFGRVFGGNNLSGEIKGTITVNIEETGCKPIIIGELYGGGNQAEYTAPSGEDGPTVNVKSFTSIGRVFGGGLGANAVVKGDTYVNIDEAIITTDKGHSTKAYAGETINFSDGKSVTLPPRPANTEGAMGIIGEVYGGGNEAKVVGNTNVNIATLVNVDFESLTTDKTKEVKGANIVGNIYGGGNQAEVTGKPTVTIGRQQP